MLRALVESAGDNLNMSDKTTYPEIIRQIGEISRRIVELVDELRPITGKIMAGDHNSENLEKSNQIQEEIGHLDELREQLRRSHRD